MQINSRAKRYAFGQRYAIQTRPDLLNPRTKPLCGQNPFSWAPLEPPTQNKSKILQPKPFVIIPNERTQELGARTLSPRRHGGRKLSVSDSSSQGSKNNRQKVNKVWVFLFFLSQFRD